MVSPSRVVVFVQQAAKCNSVFAARLDAVHILEKLRAVLIKNARIIFIAFCQHPRAVAAVQLAGLFFEPLVIL